MNRIILASGSPRRKELLGLITTDFSISVADVDERDIEDKFISDPKNLNSAGEVNKIKLAETLATAKAKAVFDLLPNQDDIVVIGSDTSVIIDNEILGKPVDKDDAIRMLTKLSGRKHSVVTGVALISKKKTISFTNESFVYFNTLDDWQQNLIKEYCETSEPYDKAGAYGIQGGGALLVERIDGDFFSIMGLPVAELARELERIRL